MHMGNTAPSWLQSNQTHGLDNTDRVARHRASLYSTYDAGSTAGQDCNLSRNQLKLSVRALIDVLVPIPRHCAYLRYSTTPDQVRQGLSATSRTKTNRHSKGSGISLSCHFPEHCSQAEFNLSSLMTQKRAAGIKAGCSPRLNSTFPQTLGQKKPSESCPHTPRPLMSAVPDCPIPADCRPLRLSRYLGPGWLVSWEANPTSHSQCQHYQIQAHQIS